VFVTESIRELVKTPFEASPSTSWSFLLLGDLRVTIIGGMLADATIGIHFKPTRERRATP
jgi:hypothetical protein